MKNAHTIVAAVAATLLTVSAYAGDDAMKERYKAAEQRCEMMQGNEKDVCMQEVKASKSAAKAQYKVDKEKCDALEGDSKNACLERAKSTYHR